MCRRRMPQSQVVLRRLRKQAEIPGFPRNRRHHSGTNARTGGADGVSEAGLSLPLPVSLGDYARLGAYLDTAPGVVQALDLVEQNSDVDVGASGQHHVDVPVDTGGGKLSQNMFPAASVIGGMSGVRSTDADGNHRFRGAAHDFEGDLPLAFRAELSADHDRDRHDTNSPANSVSRRTA